jgi:UDP-N-acetylglucosamine 2-epimerase (non-hydrolysing)
MIVGLKLDRALQMMDLLETQRRGGTRDFSLEADYCMPNVSEKVVRIIHSYTDYVRRTVWNEY